MVNLNRHERESVYPGAVSTPPVDKRSVPRHHREIVSAELRRLLAKSPSGERLYTQLSLSEAIGVTQGAVSKAAKSESAVFPAILHGVLRVTGKSLEELAAEHGLQPSQEPSGYSERDDLIMELEREGMPRELAERSADAAIVFLRSTGPLRILRLARKIARIPVE